MNNIVRKYRTQIIGVLVAIFIIYLFSSLVTTKRLSKLDNYLENEIIEQIAVVKNLATIIGRGGSNEQSELLVKQCSQNDVTKHEELLSALDTDLSASNLKDLQNLFASCGHVYAYRRSSMFFQLSREVQVLESLAIIHNSINKEDFDYQIDEWKALVAKEEEIRDHFFELVVIQKRIIDTLTGGELRNSPNVENLRIEAQNKRSELSVLTKQASELRSTLTKS